MLFVHFESIGQSRPCEPVSWDEVYSGYAHVLRSRLLMPRVVRLGSTCAYLCASSALA